LQNFPVLSSASSSGGSTTIQGSLNSRPNTTYRLEFFSSAACDPSGHGEGQTFLAATSVTTDGSGNAAFTATVTPPAGEAFLTATATDPANNTSEFSRCLAHQAGPGPSATLTLTPKTASNVVGTQHCVTATVRDSFGNPVPGISVRFSVPTGVATSASPASGQATTNASGEAIFCYSASLPGADAIHAFADTNSDGDQDAGEPFDEATKTWTPPPSTEFCEVKITQGGSIVADNGDQATFGGNAKVQADGSVQGQENYQDHGPAQPRHVKSIELTATTCSEDRTSASIFGRATIDGAGDFVFRIDVSDLGEPGRNDSYGITLSDGYASGQHRLQGGDVQIHRS
jgi:hypothetical protein